MKYKKEFLLTSNQKIILKKIDGDKRVRDTKYNLRDELFSYEKSD